MGCLLSLRLGLQFVAELFAKQTDLLGIRAWRRVLVAKIEKIPEPFFVFSMACNRDTAQFQVRCILGVEGSWYEQHGVSFAAEGVVEIGSVQTGTMNRA